MNLKFKPGDPESGSFLDNDILALLMGFEYSTSTSQKKIKNNELKQCCGSIVLPEGFRKGHFLYNMNFMVQIIQNDIYF